MRKHIAVIVFYFIVSALYAVDPIYDAETLPSSGGTLAEVPVSFTVPTDISMAFSSDPNVIYDPGVVDLDIQLRTEDGSFYVTHKDLYALWDITSESNFRIYLYLDGKLKVEKGEELDWSLAGGNSVIEGQYYTEGADIGSYAILLSDNITKNYAELTIDLDINEIIENGFVEDTYTGHVVMEYREMP